MATITTRAGKGSPLTNTEVDDNFTNLNTDKAELSGAAFTGNISVDRGNTSVYLTLTGGNPEIILNDTTAVTNTCTIQNTDGSINYRADEDNESGNSRHRFFTDGTQRMEIEANGNVGIGTDTPASKLHIHQDSTDYSILKLSNSTTGFGASDGLSIWSTGNQAAVWNYEASPLLFGTSGTERMRIDSTGNVGIGTTNPIRALHVNSGNDTIRLQSTSTNTKIEMVNTTSTTNEFGFLSDSFFVSPDGTEAMRIKSSGNVGIGTTSPDSKLDVDGTVTIGGDGSSINFTGTVGSNFITAKQGLKVDIDSDNNQGATLFSVTSNNEANNVFNVKEDGDISFYDTAGTSVKLFWDASAESLGIGTTNPAAELHIADAAANAVMRIESSNSHQGNIFFDDQAATNVGKIGYDHSDNSLRFDTASTERMRIDSSGSLLVGKTSDAFAVEGMSLRGSPTNVASVATFTRDGANVAAFNRLTNDGSLVTFYKDSTTLVGSVGTRGNDVYLETGNTGIRMFDASNAIIPVGTNGASRNGEVDLGVSNIRFRDLYLSGNVLAGATSATGDATNVKRVVGGVFTTLRDSTSVAHNTATTVATLPSGEGNYMVSASLDNSGTPSSYNEVAIVGTSQSSATITILQNAGALTLSMSGLNLQVTQSQGATQTIHFSILRIL